MRKGKLFCTLVAVTEEDRLYISRVDFQEWEMNYRDGTVEITYSFNEENTSKLYELLMADSISDFFKRLKSKFGVRTGYQEFMQNLLNFCKEHDIDYRYPVWYFVYL